MPAILRIRVFRVKGQHTHEKLCFFKGVRVVPNQFADVAGSVRMHFGVSAAIFGYARELEQATP